LAFARVFEATAQDDALDVLDLMIGSLLARVENEGDQARLRTPCAIWPRNSTESADRRHDSGVPISHAS
jgi:hypothetical protein